MRTAILLLQVVVLGITLYNMHLSSAVTGQLITTVGELQKRVIVLERVIMSSGQPL